MLRDRMVCGINDQRMQRRLLAEPDLTCKKAVELAQAIESADQNVQDLQKSTLSDLHAITPGEQWQTPHGASRPFSSCSPSQSVSVRFRFNSPCHCSGETVADYVTELRCISEHCQFADSLDAMLRDRMVCGINDQRMQRRLLAEPDLTCKKAVELAQAIESADQNVQDLQKSTLSDLHAITPGEQWQTPHGASRPFSSCSPHSGASARRSQPPSACLPVLCRTTLG